jgi:hypothetical protein
MEKKSLSPGSVPDKPRKGKSQIHNGVQPLSLFTHKTQQFQPLPIPLGDPPYHLDLETVIPGINSVKKLVFHTVGDTGGIKNSEYQMAVSKAMQTDLELSEKDRPSFFYHLGDIVYYNGQVSEYYSQFYDPYHQYDAPIFAIPGNHDGDPINDTQTSLDGWVEYFMTQKPHIDPISKDAPRVTMSQPNVYFTLNCPFATIVGMYTNVPEHGSIDSVQQQWLTNELHTAPKDKALIVCLHHPIYSFDDYHSGSPSMANALQQAINDTTRVPNMVLTGHVHNFQRIEKEIIKGTSTPFLVAGHGGYFDLHKLTTKNGDTDNTTGATMVYGNDKNHGYVTITVDGNNITGTNSIIDNKTGATTIVDNFKYTAKALFLKAGVIISL